MGVSGSVPPRCVDCDAPLSAHCKLVACNWWKCLVCGGVGNARRWVHGSRKKTA